MKERVEVIPADRFGVHCFAVWAPQPFFMPYTTTPKPAIEVLHFFLQYFEPATEHDVTELFTTAQVQKFIRQHTGEAVSIAETFSHMAASGFTSKLSDDEIKWLVRSRAVLSQAGE